MKYIDVQKYFIENNAEKYCPCLLIGSYVNKFKKVYKGNIIKISNVNDIKRLIENYDNINSISDRYLVMEGIDGLTLNLQNSLLKFIEETRIPIILLAYTDNLQPTIISRIKTIYKSFYIDTDLNFVDKNETLDIIKKKEPYEIPFYLSNKCPSLMILQKQQKDYSYNSDKVLRLI